MVLSFSGFLPMILKRTNFKMLHCYLKKIGISMKNRLGVRHQASYLYTIGHVGSAKYSKSFAEPWDIRVTGVFKLTSKNRDFEKSHDFQLLSKCSGEFNEERDQSKAKRFTSWADSVPDSWKGNTVFIRRPEDDRCSPSWILGSGSRTLRRFRCLGEF